MTTATIGTTATIAGLSISLSLSRSGEGQIGQEVTLPVGNAGTLSTRTDANTGVATLSGGHTITTSDIVDVYWSTGVRYGMTATVATNAVTVDGGSGDDLPSQGVAVVVTEQVTINADFDGDDAVLIVAQSNRRANLAFQEEDGTAVAAIEIPAGEGFSWTTDSPFTNPLTGNAIGKIQASCGDSSNAATLRFALLYDSVA